MLVFHPRVRTRAHSPRWFLSSRNLWSVLMHHLQHFAMLLICANPSHLRHLRPLFPKQQNEATKSHSNPPPTPSPLQKRHFLPRCAFVFLTKRTQRAHPF